MTLALATLGPHGSDSEHAAQLIASEYKQVGDVILLNTFADAMRYALENDALALIPAAYVERDAAGTTKTNWADNHFRLESDGELKLITARVLPLKAMVVAVREQVTKPRTVALHAATQFLAKKYLPNATPVYATSKPVAVELCAIGETDACIGSLDVVRRYPQLKVIHRTDARMCWTIYGKSLELLGAC